jgi:hypothetical protein
MKPLYSVCPASHRGTQRVEPLHEPRDPGLPFGIALSNRYQYPDAPHPLTLLRARRERPRSRRPTEQRNELAPPHSITYSPASGRTTRLRKSRKLAGS